MKSSRSNKRFRKSNKTNKKNKQKRSSSKQKRSSSKQKRSSSKQKRSSSKQKRISGSKRNKMQKQKGGNCGCGSTMHGGNLQASPYYYPLNDHANDPLAPASIIDSRQLPDMKGGMNGTQLFSAATDPFFNTDSLKNPVLSFGTSAGAVSQNTLLTESPSLENTNLTQANFSNTQKYLA
jgi:hypothetical protein